MVLVAAATYFQGRTDVQCLHRWQKVLNPQLIKGSWTNEVCCKLCEELQLWLLLLHPAICRGVLCCGPTITLQLACSCSYTACRRIKRSPIWLGSLEPRNGLSLPHIYLAESASSAGSGKHQSYAVMYGCHFPIGMLSP